MTDVVDADTIMQRCDELAAVTAMSGGIERVHLSPEHARVNELAAQWMTEAGMTTWMDAAGNQCGRYEGTEPGMPALVLGSHLDSVPDAGRYDGILGVMLAIAVVSRLSAAGSRLPFALEVVAFGDEEGTRFGTSLLGSRAFAGTLDPQWLEVTDSDGISVVDAYRTFGLDPAKITDAARTADQLVGYLEAHIEQGPYLEEAGKALGVVSTIAGSRRFQVTITGKAGHAGGVPWERRRDALVGASEAVLAVERIAKAAGSIATVGQLRVWPGGVNVIPGRVELSLDLRDKVDHDRDATWAEIQQAFAEISQRRKLTFDVAETSNAPAKVTAPWLRSAISAGIVATGDADPMVLFSKAGHDGMAIAELCDYAMLFIRCAGGISHHPDESVISSDVEIALDAFEAAVHEVAAQYEPRSLSQPSRSLSLSKGPDL